MPAGPAYCARAEHGEFDGERRAITAVASCALLLSGCGWQSLAAPAPASRPVVEGVEVVLVPVIELQGDGTRGPRPTPTATWDGGQGGWSYDAPELVIELADQDDAGGYAIGHDGELFSTHTGDLTGGLSLSLRDSDVAAGDVLEVHAYREDAPGFPHEAGTARAAGLSPPAEIVVPPH